MILVKLYELLKCSNFDDIILEYAGLYNATLKSLQQGNLMKNSLKIQDDFYFSAFHPIDDYSLQVINYIEKCIIFLFNVIFNLLLILLHS